MFELDRLILVTRGESRLEYYHRNFWRDITDALEELEVSRCSVDIKAELISQLCEEDELDDIVGHITDLKELKKSEILDRLPVILKLLEAKQDEFNTRTEYASSL